jgi:hypothetical protein
MRPYKYNVISFHNNYSPFLEKLFYRLVLLDSGHSIH